MGGDRQERRRRRLPRRPIAVRYQGAELAYRIFDIIRKVNQAAVVANKRLGSLLEMISAYQETKPAPKRRSRTPERRDQAGYVFSVG